MNLFYALLIMTTVVGMTMLKRSTVAGRALTAVGVVAWVAMLVTLTFGGAGRETLSQRPSDYPFNEDAATKAFYSTSRVSLHGAILDLWDEAHAGRAWSHVAFVIAAVAASAGLVAFGWVADRHILREREIFELRVRVNTLAEQLEKLRT
jgi:hypothetical protein